MKQTVNVNIGSVAFTLDEDAYELLKLYFDDVRRRLAADGEEIMADIESRMAEIFRERVSSPMRVITVEVVRAAMEQMGSPADFGSPCDGDGIEGEENREAPKRKLYRSRTDKSIAGVCAGIAGFVGIDVTLLRLITLFLILFGGLSIWVYILLWLILQEEPEQKIFSKQKVK